MTEQQELSRFYAELDALYTAHENEKTEAFLRDCLARADGVPPAAVHNELACFLRGQSRWAEALTQFTAAQEALGEETTPEYAVILLNRANCCRMMGRLPDAFSLYERAGAMLRAGENTPPAVLAGLNNNLGLALLDDGQSAAAKTRFEEALALLGPEQTEERGTTWNNLAAAALAMGREDEAARAAERAADLLSELDGGTNPHYAAALNTMGTAALRGGHPAEALDAFERAARLTKRCFGENADYAAGCANCAAVCEELGRGEAAERWRQEAARVRERLRAQG